ncbi:MAG: SMC-Scp complex subunit ScpB [Bacteroidota bacterium]
MKPSQITELFQSEDFLGIEFNEEILADALSQIMLKYRDDLFVFELRQIDGGYQFFTKKDYYPFVKHAALAKSTRRMSRASLETLSIIAYKQPITKTEIEHIRGVNCDYAVSKLLEKNLIEIRGRAEVAGRPLIYGTTAFFMEYFALNDLKDLPRLDELNSEEREIQAAFKVYDDEEDQELNPMESLELEDDQRRLEAIGRDDAPAGDEEAVFHRLEGEFAIKDSEEE